MKLLLEHLLNHHLPILSLIKQLIDTIGLLITIEMVRSDKILLQLQQVLLKAVRLTGLMQEILLQTVFQTLTKEEQEKLTLAMHITT